MAALRPLLICRKQNFAVASSLNQFEFKIKKGDSIFIPIHFPVVYEDRVSPRNIVNLQKLGLIYHV